MSKDELEQLLKEVEPGRRDFLKKLLLGVGYLTPIVSVFTMQALTIDSAMAQMSNICSNLTGGELQIEKTVSPAVVVAGEELTYTIMLRACYPLPIGRMSFSDPLPVGTTFVSAQQISGPTFALTLPLYGSEGGTVSGLADAPPVDESVSIFEIVVLALP